MRTALAWLAGCAAHATATPALVNVAPVTPPSASAACFQRIDLAPDAKPIVLRRTLDPAHRTITEQLYTAGAISSAPVVVTVTGDHFGHIDEGIDLVGHLVGPAWRWTSWVATQTYESGTKETVDATLTDAGLTEHHSIAFRTGGPGAAWIATYARIVCVF